MINGKDKTNTEVPASKTIWDLIFEIMSSDNPNRYSISIEKYPAGGFEFVVKYSPLDMGYNPFPPLHVVGNEFKKI